MNKKFKVENHVVEKVRKLFPEDILEFIDACKKEEHPESQLIAVLHKVQDHFGYLSKESLDAVAQLMQIPTAKVTGVATFYHYFRLKKQGKFLIRVCIGTACHVKGGRSIIRAISRILGVQEGKTTEDMEFTFETVACLGACALAPVMVVDGVYYGKMTSQKVNFVLDSVGTSGKETA